MPRTDDWFSEPDDLEPTSETWDFPLERRRARKRLAMTGTLVTLFFAGAAFTALGGDLAATKLQGEECSQQANTADVADTTACDAQAADATAMAAAPEATPSADPAAALDASASATPGAPAATPEATPAPAADATAATPDDAEPQAANVGSTHRTPAQPTFRSHTVRPIASKHKGGGAVRGGSGGGAGAASSATSMDAHALPVLAPAATVRVPMRHSARLTAKGTITAPKPEIERHDGIPTVWLNRALPDPTPPAKRLRLAFAAKLAADAKKAGVDWALVLGVLRASGESGSMPATNAELKRLTSRLAGFGAARNKWQAILRLDGHTEFADQALALARYNRAVGLWALVHGLEAAKPAMTQRILKDPKITIYSGGRSDLDQGRVDVRVIALIAYLRQTFGQVTVSCLISGHRLYARPGVISRHIYGQAVDIASLGGTTVLGHQQEGSVTEAAVRDTLLLPSELQPQQVISLIGLGGPSFPLANHFDHIHVGY